MHRYLLDTNILSALIKRPHNVLAQKIGHCRVMRFVPV
jgi:predicted nucleic acid-binding protein